MKSQEVFGNILEKMFLNKQSIISGPDILTPSMM